MKVGISAVSVEAARKNLAAEIPAWDFDGHGRRRRRVGTTCWAGSRSRPSTRPSRETFYTALYHAAWPPRCTTTWTAVIAAWTTRSMAAEGFQNYCTFSLWDTFRAEHPLLTIVQPQRVDDFVGTMLAHYRQFGQHTMPIWPLAGNETWCMIGNHAVPVIAEAYRKGFRRYDAEAVYAGHARRRHAGPQPDGRVPRKGYVPSARTQRGEQNQSVSPNAGICLRRLVPGRKWPNCWARRTTPSCSRQRAENYRQRVRPGRGIHARQDGRRQVARAVQSYQVFWADYTEATAWQYTFFVPQNVPALVELMGGDKAVRRQDRQDVHRQDSGLAAELPTSPG